MKITLAIMCYRQQQFIHETLQGAFAQDFSGLDILISDDDSPDGTYDEIRRAVDAYQGPHNVRINRNQPNKGLIGHINHLFTLAGDSDLIVYNPGDDISEPWRVSTLAAAHRQTGAVLIHSDATDINAQGGLWRGGRVQRVRAGQVMGADLVAVAKTESSCLGASCAWSPEIMDRCGPITETGAIEDRVLYFRARLMGRAHYIDEKLIRYRRGVGLTARKADDIAAERRGLQASIASYRQRLKDAQILTPGREDIADTLRGRIGRREKHLRALDARDTETGT